MVQINLAALRIGIRIGLSIFREFAGFPAESQSTTGSNVCVIGEAVVAQLGVLSVKNANVHFAIVTPYGLSRLVVSWKHFRHLSSQASSQVSPHRGVTSQLID